MNIGIDIRTLMDARYSGVSEYTYRLLRSILAADRENEFSLFYNSGRDMSQRLAEWNRYPNARLFPRRYPNKLFNYCLQKVLRRPRIDLVTGAGVFFMPHINFIALSRRARLVLTVHDLSFLRFPRFFSARKNIWHFFVNARRLARRADRIAAVSENTKADLVDLCNVAPERIMVIPSGVGREYKPVGDNACLRAVREKYRLPEDFILYLGTIEPRKNIAGLIRAFEIFSRAGENGRYALVIAGGQGWKSGEISAAWRSSPAKDRIIFTGYIEDADKPALYTLARVFVYPSFYEGFGFPPLEAMACGTPVVTSDVASMPEVAGDAAVLTDPYDPPAIGRALGLAANDERLRASLIARGRDRAAQFDWEKTAAAYSRLFCETARQV